MRLSRLPRLSRLFITLTILVLSAIGLLAQATNISNIGGVGVSYNPGGSPSIAGTGLYARLMNTSTGTWAFIVNDALPTTLKPFTVTSNIGAGVAQRVVIINGIPIYIPTTAGISWTGSNTGWQWSTGGLAVIGIKGGWKLLPSLRVLKSSVNNNSGYQVIGGLGIGWEW